MSEQSNTILSVAGLAGALYLGHRWLTKEENKASAAIAPVPDVEPVSSPSQVDGVATRPNERARAGDGISRQFDSIFAEQGQSMPAAYLRALASRESDMNPDLTDGPAWGLMQITETDRRGYNQRHGTAFARTDLLNPSISVAIAADTLRTIIKGWARAHPDIPNLQEDWRNPRFVELLTFGWNAGFSEKAGVGRVTTYLRGLGFTDITLDMVYAHAGHAGASPQLSREDKVRFSKSVARLFQRESARADVVGANT